MALIIKDTKEYKYIPLSERGEDKPFTVWFKPLSTKSLATLEDGYIVIKDETSISIQTGSYNIKAVQASLLRWENISEDGQDISVKRNNKGMVLDSIINYIPQHLITEIGTVIVNVSKLPNEAEDFLGMDEFNSNDTKTKKK